MRKKVRNNGPVKKPMKPRSYSNSLGTKFPNLAKEWDYKKNYPLTPKDINYGTTYKVYWICSKGHSYQMAINNRTSTLQQGCPYCSSGGNRIWSGNCLATICPEIAKEWHPTKNKSKTPNDVTYASPQKVWWLCKKGHEWKCSVYERSLARLKNKKRGNCPYCSGKRVSAENCLATCDPKLSSEWHPYKNKLLTPKDVTACSGKRVWWMCFLGHKWKTSVSHRNNGTGCPYCNRIVLKDGTMHDSMTEAYFYLKLKDQGKCIIRHGKYKGLGNFRFDFYLPKENRYIEVTGFGERWPEIWHQYLKIISKKRNHVIKKLGGKFSFKQKRLTSQELLYVRNNML